MRLFWTIAKSPYPVMSAEQPASGGTSGASQAMVLPRMVLPDPMRMADCIVCTYRCCR